MAQFKFRALGVRHTKFIDEFFPKSIANPAPKVTTNPFTNLRCANTPKMKEAQIAKIFMQAVNDHNLVPGYKLLRSGKQPDSEVVDSLGRKVDSALFPTSRVRTDQTPNWPDQIIPFVWKIDHPTNDVFVDLEDKSVQCLDHRELAAYLELLFQVQQRTAVFMFFIIGRKFRLLRWDRSGAIVSDAVDYYLHWEVLCEVFRRISFLSDEQLGFDATAMRLSPGDGDHEKMDNYAKSRKEDISHLEETSVQLVGDVVPIFEYVRGAFRQSLHPHWPRYRVQVPDGKIMRSFLIGKPVIAAKGMVGRGTRGYIALDCHTWGFVWLKDAWRAHCLIVDKEGDILKALNDANVPNVPTLICHGDLPGQDTVTPSWWEQKYPRKEANSDQPEPTLDQPNNSQAAFNQGDLEPSAASKDDDGELVPFFDRAEGAPSGESTFDKGDDDYYEYAIYTETSAGSKRKRSEEHEESEGEAEKAASELDSEVDTDGWSGSGSRSGSGAEEDEVEGLLDESSNEPAYRQDCPLRPHRHYRSVVSEIGMSLSRFTHGRQLVTIIFDCVMAHFHAVEHAGFMHRDVSGGNIVILPKIVSQSDKSRVVMWSGMLIDWELARAVPVPGAPRIMARQREWTGTWQFMSANQLSHRGIPVTTTTDELESFLHVLLYYAVRYIRSNLPKLEVGNWIEDFFDSFTFKNGQYSCGHMKSTIMKHTGLLTIDKHSPPTLLKFGSPMDYLLGCLTVRFLAFYRVQAYEAAQSGAAPPISSNILTLPTVPAPFARQYSKKNFRALEPRGIDMQPTEEEYRRAEEMKDHETMLEELSRSLQQPWPQDDKVGDRVPVDWVPARLIGPVAKTHLTSDSTPAKKQKTDQTPDFIPDNLHSAPPSLDQAPQKTTATDSKPAGRYSAAATGKGRRGVNSVERTPNLGLDGRGEVYFVS